MTEAARNVLRHIDTVVSDNAEPLRTLIANINTFSAALARNSDRVDGIVAGLEKMTGGGAQKSAAHVFDLRAVQNFPTLASVPQGQLVVPEPDVIGNVFNDEIIVKTPSGERSTSFQAKWPDSITRVVQSRIVQSLENAGYLKALGRQPEGLKIDYQLLVDMRSFQVLASDKPTAEIAFSAKIISSDGEILAARLFEVKVPASTVDEASVAASLNAAFGKAITDLVGWTFQSVQKARNVPASAPAVEPQDVP
jgi:phospholipid/cholesterol/gamma-HCH transport system substrate-binding protein